MAFDFGWQRYSDWIIGMELQRIRTFELSFNLLLLDYNFYYG